MPWRIPHQERDLFDINLVERAAMPAGVRLSFRSDTTTLTGRFNLLEERSPIDLVVNGKYVRSVDTANRKSFRFDDIGPGMKEIELWLPQFGEFTLETLRVDDWASVVEPSPSNAPKWITYGSSITHCRAADSPTQTWPAIVARTRGYDLTCLGFGGQCHLDPMVARVIRDRDADLISMCLGINIYGANSLSPRTFYPGILGFVQIIREKHPTTPIALFSPIYSPGREDTPNEVGFTLKQMRNEVARAVETLKTHGDSNITYIDGLDIFSSDNAHLLPDDLHPNNEGYGIMASNLLKLLPRV
jgi:lysophospholipase L1-like esterase